MIKPYAEHFFWLWADDDNVSMSDSQNRIFVVFCGHGRLYAI